MVFGKKKQEAKDEPSVLEYKGPEVRHQGGVAVQAGPQVEDGLDLKGAIDEFNATYPGLFSGELGGSQALLFAVYVELRALRRAQ